MNLRSGGCLCGKTRYSVTLPSVSQGICYCRQCQKAGSGYGSPLMVLSKASLDCAQLRLSSIKTQSNRGSVVTRHFCKDCGSHVFAEISDVPGLITLRAATLDDFTDFVPEYLVWTKSANQVCAFPKGVAAFPESAPMEILLGSLAR